MYNTCTSTKPRSNPTKNIRTQVYTNTNIDCITNTITPFPIPFQDTLGTVNSPCFEARCYRYTPGNANGLDNDIPIADIDPGQPCTCCSCDDEIPPTKGCMLKLLNELKPPVFSPFLRTHPTNPNSLFFESGYMTILNRSGVLISMMNDLNQEMVINELVEGSSEILTSQFTYSYIQPCQGGTQLLVTPEPSIRNEDYTFRQFQCTEEENVDSCNRNSVILYSGANLEESLTQEQKKGCPCFGKANAGILNNHILLRLPTKYIRLPAQQPDDFGEHLQPLRNIREYQQHCGLCTDSDVERNKHTHRRNGAGAGVPELAHAPSIYRRNYQEPAPSYVADLRRATE